MLIQVRSRDDPQTQGEDNFFFFTSVHKYIRKNSTVCQINMKSHTWIGDVKFVHLVIIIYGVILSSNH